MFLFLQTLEKHSALGRSLSQVHTGQPGASWSLMQGCRCCFSDIFAILDFSGYFIQRAPMVCSLEVYSKAKRKEGRMSPHTGRN